MDVLYSGRNFAKHISGTAPEKQKKNGERKFC